MTVIKFPRNVCVPLKYEPPLPRQRVFYLGIVYNGPALPDDVITGVNGQLVNNLESFYKTVWSSRNYGVIIKVDVMRNGKKMNFNVRSINRMDYYLKSNSY